MSMWALEKTVHEGDKRVYVECSTSKPAGKQFSLAVLTFAAQGHYGKSLPYKIVVQPIIVGGFR